MTSWWITASVCVLCSSSAPLENLLGLSKNGTRISLCRILPRFFSSVFIINYHLLLELSYCVMFLFCVCCLDLVICTCQVMARKTPLRMPIHVEEISSTKTRSKSAFMSFYD